VECPECGWKVPLLPSRIVHIGQKVIAELVPDKRQKTYRIQILSGVDKKHFRAAEKGTVEREGKYGEAYLVHQVDGNEHRVKISTLRGDFQRPDGTIGNQLRQWEVTDFKPRDTDIFRERLYCVQWIRRKPDGRGEEYEFRSVTDADLRRESVVDDYVSKHLAEWQSSGVAPDSRIEVGGPPRYQGLDLIRARGWTHWHHVFNPRQLLVAALVNKYSDAKLKFGLTQLLNSSSKLSRWLPESAGQVKGTFDNQALNTIFNYGCRSAGFAADILTMPYKRFDCGAVERTVANGPADKANVACDLFITDPPYGDAVKYEEILDFFIAWLRKNPPPEFANWVWDSRRALAIKGEDDDFRRGMVAAYKRMTELMPDNGLQIIMFTHQSGSIWADMANIVWASGLHVTAAWYVVTETDSALREGSYVKGTVLLVLRKRLGDIKTGRDDLAWEIQEEVEQQVATLTGLNQSLAGTSRTPNQFSDADLQMAGYAAALRVLTRYSVIDGRPMAEEAMRPRQRGEATMVDELIEFAVGVANNSLVPTGLTKAVWDTLRPAERFYLKLLELERRGFKTIDNYQNFAKAFKVSDFKALMASVKANAARLKSASELGRAEMSGESELANTPLRGVLYALMELQKDVDSDEVLQHLSFNVEDYFAKRPVLKELSGYLAKHLTGLREDEASAARVLHDLIENQRL
jgi:putative DNA methylase